MSYTHPSRFKKYNRGIRAARVLAEDNKFFVNRPENAAAELLDRLGRAFSKRGYPDFTVYNLDGPIYGFIEVKPHDERELKTEQRVFSEFCHKYGIPFIMWCPTDGLDKIKTFLQIKEN